MTVEEKEVSAMPSFKCKDIGMNDGFEVKADTQEEILAAAAAHAEIAHHMKPIPPETMEKIKKAIKK